MEQILTVIAETVYLSAIIVLFSLSESLFYHVKAKTINFNEHIIWTALRVVVFAPVLVHWFMMFSWWSVIGYFGILLYFIFLHDSFYYHFRNKFNKDVYPKGFKDVSKTSTAWVDSHVGTPDWNSRMASLIVGLFLMFGMVAGFLTQ